MLIIESENIAERMRASVSMAWVMFSQKVGNDLISINKEASMQLQYAYILQQLIPLMTYRKGEEFQVELETGVNVNGKSKEIDIMFSGYTEGQKHSISIEMKCYRTIASSGGKRGATDIFMKDVYEDLYLLEQYVMKRISNEGVALVMNDMARLVKPDYRNGKCWDYDISNGSIFGPCTINTPIGGKPVNIVLSKKYNLQWKQCGTYWFLEV